MDKRYNLSNLQAQFTDYLIAENISTVTLKNYRSDIKYFFNWSAKQHSDSSIALVTAYERLVEYKEFLISNDTPQRTINRRLSAVRKFCTFCISQGWLSENPGKKVLNHTTSHSTQPTCHPGLDPGSSYRVANEMLNQVQHDNTYRINLLLEFKHDFSTDFDNLHDFFEIINYPQTQGK